jgi:nucleotide-binding universal stress UspA family protein
MTTCHDIYEDFQDPVLSAGERIVVGVDGSPGSIAALRWAFAHRTPNGPPPVAVNVWESPALVGVTSTGYPIPTPPVDRDRIRTSAEAVLRQTVDEALGGAGREVTSVTLEDPSASHGLSEFSRNAAMLVVGAHRRHGLGLLLGSTASRCIREARCPVVVVPADWHN